MANAPLVSIVCVPREGFRAAPACLERLIEDMVAPFRLIYVDGNAPPVIAQQIRRRVVGSGGTLLRSERYLKPTRARNLGLREVRTPYVVFLDNDVLVTPGWLEALVACAEETNAAFVSPVICMGDRNPRIVHVAGGENRIVEENGRRWFVEDYDHAERPLSDVLGEIDRQPTGMAEFHAVLVRTEALRDLGALDEGCSTAFEHNDLCLSLLARNLTGWLEPKAVVDYVQDDATTPENFEYHMLRWCRRWIDESLVAFCAKWRLSPAAPMLVRDLESLHSRRRRATARARRVANTIGGRWMVACTDMAADVWTNRVLRLRHESEISDIEVDGAV